MIVAILINPQIFHDTNGNKVSFENTMVVFDSDQNAVIERRNINLPYETPDEDVEAMVEEVVQKKVVELGVVQGPSDKLEWDWPMADKPEGK